jgi:hypothetical protein
MPNALSHRCRNVDEKFVKVRSLTGKRGPRARCTLKASRWEAWLGSLAFDPAFDSSRTPPSHGTSRMSALMIAFNPDVWLSIAHMTRPSLRVLPLMMKAS